MGSYSSLSPCTYTLANHTREPTIKQLVSASTIRDITWPLYHNSSYCHPFFQIFFLRWSPRLGSHIAQNNWSLFKVSTSVEDSIFSENTCKHALRFSPDNYSIKSYANNYIIHQRDIWRHCCEDYRNDNSFSVSIYIRVPSKIWETIYYIHSWLLCKRKATRYCNGF